MDNWKQIPYESLPEHIRFMLERPNSFIPFYMYLKEGRFAYLQTKSGNYMAQVDGLGEPTGVVYKDATTQI